MAVFQAVMEILPFIADSPELLKLGGQGAIIDELSTQIINLVARGYTLGSAVDRVRNRYSGSSVVEIGRSPGTINQNIDFINRVNQGVRENTLRQRRPIGDTVIDIKEDEPIVDRMPRPIRNRGRIRIPPSLIGAGVVTAGVGAGLVGSSGGSNVAPDEVKDGNTNPPISTPAVDVGDNLPDDTVGDNSVGVLLNKQSDPALQNLGITGAFKYPKEQANDSIAQYYAYQTYYNSLNRRPTFL